MIEYSRHAREKMAERELEEKWILLCLSDPDIEIPEPDTGCTVYLRCLPGRSQMLRVVVPDNRPNFIVSVYFDHRFPCPGG